MKKVNSSIKKTRLYATVIYPESAPDDWLDRLSDLCVPALLSPLHDKDVNNGSGEKKKSHYHLLIMFDGPKTEKQFEEIKDYLGGVGIEYVQSLRGYARYLCHLDNPEKFQYNIEDVRCFAGADYESIIGTSYDKKSVVREIMQFIDRSHVQTYSQLLRYASYRKPDWFSYLLDSSYVIKEYLKGIQEEIRGVSAFDDEMDLPEITRLRNVK